MSFSFGPSAIHASRVFIIPSSPSWEDFETIERKGLGHPDTISDTLAAKISQAYCAYTIKNCEGLILHHQIDKLMVIGGKTKVSFGSGEFVEPIRIIVAGRATYSFKNTTIPVNTIVKNVVRSHFAETFPIINFEKDIVIENKLTSYAGPGTITSSTGAISQMFSPDKKEHVRGYEKLVANDTSYCVAYYPYSPLEKAVLEIEAYLNSTTTKITFPWLGTDIKIMAVRNAKDISITTCIPQIAAFVPSFEEYKNNLEKIGAIIEKLFTTALQGYTIEIAINTKDDYEKMNVYITVSGASLSGDIGVVGRGNRTNGLITSSRPMSMEGTNGKNPRYYSGFVYGVLTKKIARAIYEKTGKPTVVEIVSQNGGLLKNPWRVRIQTAANKKLVTKIVRELLDSVESITEDFVKGNIVNF